MLRWLACAALVVTLARGAAAAPPRDPAPTIPLGTNASGAFAPARDRASVPDPAAPPTTRPSDTTFVTREVPEPATASLVGAGFLLLLLVRVRERRSGTC